MSDPQGCGGDHQSADCAFVLMFMAKCQVNKQELGSPPEHQPARKNMTNSKQRVTTQHQPRRTHTQGRQQS